MTRDTQAIGTDPTTTYAYLDTGNQVTTMAAGQNITYSTIDALGNRLATSTGASFGWIIPDLHGNVVAAVGTGSSPAIVNAFRYDAYGETLHSWTGTGSVNVPWRFQGRLLENAEGATDLYDFGARSYDPSLGAFTSFDSVAGSAQNPLTLNRYLYDNANPATLVDPDGHAAGMYGGAYVSNSQLITSYGGPGGEAACSGSNCSTAAILAAANAKHDAAIAAAKLAAMKAAA